MVISHSESGAAEVTRARGGGFTLIECLITLLLTGVVIQGGWTLFATFRRSGEGVALGAQELESIRTVGWLLSEEFGGGRKGLDWWEGGSDSVVVRAYRGLALVQEWRGGEEVVVCVRGVRGLDPGKDSLLTLGEDGRWEVGMVTDRRWVASTCVSGSPGQVESWRVEAAGHPWVLARFFEPRSYHFSGGAFRYRRPGGGRQPLTPVNVSVGSFVGSGDSIGGVGWKVEVASPLSREDSTISWWGRVR
jgi:hypothetical protein